MRLGPFELDAAVRSGGMADVWCGRHVRGGTPVAVKVIRPQFGERPSYRTALLKEVALVARLAHPGIVEVFDCGLVDAAAVAASGGTMVEASPWVAMEWVEESLLEGLGPAPSWDVVKSVVLGLLDALAYAHARGVIHRDIKPSNILLDRVGGRPRARLVDFGIGRSFELQPSTSGDAESRMSGTPDYMAPEQIRGAWREQGPWTDLYAVGCLAWRLVCGATPYRTDGLRTIELLERHLRWPIPMMAPQISVPEGLREWLEGLLAKEPAHRSQHAADAARELMRLGSPTEPVRVAPRALEPSPEPPTLVLAALERVERDAPTVRIRARPAPGQREPMPETWRGGEIRRPMALVGAGMGLYGLRTVPFEGREVERDQLWQTLRAVHEDGKPRLVVVRGGAGVGKSRLVEWLGERASELGVATMLRVRHSAVPELGEGLARSLASWFQCWGLGREGLAAHLRRQLGWHAPRDAADARVLASWMALALDRVEVREEVEGDAKRWHPVVLRVLGGLADQRPVMLWLDDVQWAADGLGIVRSLLARRHMEPMPILVVATAQEEALSADAVMERQIEELCEADGAVTMELSPLSRGAHRRLVEQMLRLEGELGEEVARRTEGNPLFAVHVVGDLIQREVLEVGEHGFRLRAGASASLPTDLHDLWRGRVRALAEALAMEALAPVEQGMGLWASTGRGGAEDVALAVELALEVAATLGSEVDRREWQAACRVGGVPILPALKEALFRQRLVEPTPRGWVFSHSLLRQTLLHQAAHAGRHQALHAACVAMLQAMYTSDVPGIAERLARHLSEGGRADAAVPHLLAAARQRRSHGYLERSAELLAAAASALGPDGDARLSAEVALSQARTEVFQGRTATAMERVQQLAGGVRAAGWDDLLGEVHHVSGIIGHRGGALEEARGHFVEGLVCFERAGDDAGAAACLNGLGQLAALTASYDEAAGHYRRGAALSEGRFPAVWANCMTGLADVSWRRGEFDDARARTEQAMAYYRRVGSRSGVVGCLNTLGNVAVAQRELGEAEARYLEALGWMAPRSGEAGALRLNLATMLIRHAGALERASSVLSGGDALLLDAGMNAFLPVWQAAVATCRAGRGEWLEVRTLMEALADGLGPSMVPFDDVADCAWMVARFAGEAGQQELACLAARVSAAHWAGVGQPHAEAEGLAIGCAKPLS